MPPPCLGVLVGTVVTRRLLSVSAILVIPGQVEFLLGDGATTSGAKEHSREALGLQFQSSGELKSQR